MSVQQRVSSRLRGLRVLVAALAAAAGVAAADPAPAAAMAPSPPKAHIARVCPAAAHRDMMVCQALVRSDVASVRGLVRDGAPAGFGPSDLRAAYNLPASGGSGATIAVIDAYDDPSAEADLAVYRAQYGLSPCTTANGCFRKASQVGRAAPLPAASADWAAEVSLDVDMASAVCPSCHLLLMEADSGRLSDLGTAVDTAVNLGAAYISNSYGGFESPSDPSYDARYFDHPGVAITAAAGDAGYGVGYPAASRRVTAVGGTSLTRSPTARGWSEQVWGSSAGGIGTGSGCSVYEAKPSWQTGIPCPGRAVADVSAVADPATGVAAYDTYAAPGWRVFGGTSAAAPIIAGVYALAGTPAAGSYPASYPYARPSSLYDVTTGANGGCGSYLCNARPGYDGPTGLGTPDGTAAFTGGGHILANRHSVRTRTPALG